MYVLYMYFLTYVGTNMCRFMQMHTYVLILLTLSVLLHPPGYQSFQGEVRGPLELYMESQ